MLIKKVRAEDWKVRAEDWRRSGYQNVTVEEIA
jgi:hypothetical protein